MNENYTSRDTKNKLIQLRVSESDKNKLVEYSNSRGGLSFWLLNTALKEASKK